MERLIRRLAQAVFAIALLAAVAPSASAQGLILSLDNVALTDGGTAGGAFGVNVYGNLSGGDITTTLGTALPGFDYEFNGLVGAQITNGGLTVTAFDNTYGTFIQLDLANPIMAAMNGSDPITGGIEECHYGTCPNGVPDGSSRTIILSDNPVLLVPEPASFALLATALLLLGLTRTTVVPTARAKQSTQV